jgi:hypothetical protein
VSTVSAKDSRRCCSPVSVLANALPWARSSAYVDTHIVAVCSADWGLRSVEVTRSNCGKSGTSDFLALRSALGRRDALKVAGVLRWVAARRRRGWAEF